jgi:hypothetical protein
MQMLVVQPVQRTISSTYTVLLLFTYNNKDEIARVMNIALIFNSGLMFSCKMNVILALILKVLVTFFGLAHEVRFLGSLVPFGRFSMQFVIL